MGGSGVSLLLFLLCVLISSSNLGRRPFQTIKIKCPFRIQRAGMRHLEKKNRTTLSERL